MAGGFSFPPPPPPPPKPTTQTQQPEFEYLQQSERGGRGRGGFESRGRGGSGRGRGGGQGNSNFEPLGQHQRQNFNQGPNTAQPRERFEASINVQPPPGSHINPNFPGQRQGATARHQPTPGNQTRHGSDSGERPFNDARPSYTANRRLSNDGPGRTQAGHKRKLDALRGPQQPREKKPGLQTAPAVPSFGAPILPPAPSSTTIRPPTQSQNVNISNRAYAGARTLGLTPKDGIEPDYPSESEDEEFDEEAQFAELGTKLTFEHNGEVMTLNNEADLAAWKEERRKQFPTTTRVSQRHEEATRIGEERKRLLAAVARLHQAPRNRNSEAKTRSLREPPKSTEATLVPMLLNADMPEQESAKSNVAPLGIQEIEDPTEKSPMASALTFVAEATQDIDMHHDGDTVTSAHESTVPRQELSQPRALPGINMDETDEESDAEEAAAEEEVAGIAPIENEAEPASDAESDDDGPPEQVSSKPRPSAASGARRPICRYFSASGMCRDGDSCRFRHELSSRAPSARPPQPQPDKPAFDRFAPKLDPKTDVKKSIFERLMEQEEQSDNRLALQVIKALGQAGLFKQQETEV
ncbi:hypothetical protein MBLNU13_g10694t1 [Cladosporium sp. NU13]